MAKPTYKRILLKVSGEVLAGDQSFGIEPQFLNAMADQIVAAAQSGVRSRSSSAPATSSAAWPSPPRAPTASPPT